MRIQALAATALILGLPALAATNVPYPGEAPGKAHSKNLSLSNNALSWAATLKDNNISFTLTPAGQDAIPSSADAFSITTSTGTYPSSSFTAQKVAGGAIKANPKACRNSEKMSGIHFGTCFENQEAGIIISWDAELRDNANYVKQTYKIEATKDIHITHIQLVNLADKGFNVEGSSKGSPLVNKEKRAFFGIENPVGVAQATEDGGKIGFDCKIPMTKGQSNTFTTVSGVYPEGQLRRGFLSYIENERAQPYSLFLNYNCWYDHGLMPTEENMLATVKDYGSELVKKRKIKLDSFVLDDGWDDYRVAMWMPTPKKFPNGFGKLTSTIRSIDSNFGIWISPFGGYSGDRERTDEARRKGLIPEDQKSLDLSFKGYHDWFLNRCSELMKKDGVNYFKWDRAGEGEMPHFMALMDIAADLRKINDKVFINTTVGTWPSPFWLNHVDCIWRTGTSDVNWIGKGSNREQYINYRDAVALSHIVKKAPLFPLNSLMHHGIVLGTQFQGLRTSDKREYAAGKAQEPEAGSGDRLTDTTKNPVNFPVDNNLKKDIRMLMGAGANLQELYLTPGMMNDKAWDDVAEAVRWSNKYEDVTADTHWVGGDPAKGEVYGYCAWRGDRGATLALRNPDDQAKSIEISVDIFEPTREGGISMPSAYKDQRLKGIKIPATGTVTIELEPFEVLVFSTRFDKKAKK